MVLDMTNDAFAEAWFVQALRMAKTDVDWALKQLEAQDSRAARERLLASKFALEKTLDDWDAAVTEKDRRNREALARARQHLERTPEQRRTPLPKVFPLGDPGPAFPPPLFLQSK